MVSPRGDFSRFSQDPSNIISNFMQQGRALYDADLNNNVQSFLHAKWKESINLFGKAACVGDSFRIVKYIPIDHMLEPQLWKPIGKDHSQENSRGYIFLNTNDIPRVEGGPRLQVRKARFLLKRQMRYKGGSRTALT